MSNKPQSPITPAGNAIVEPGPRPPWICVGLPDQVEWTRLRLPIPRLDPRLASLRLIHLTDLHMRRAWCRGYDRLIERINAANADLLLFTGDFVEDKRDYRPAWPMVRRLVEPLRARLGRFAVLGNHDSDMLVTLLQELGIAVIEHQRIRLSPASHTPAAPADASAPAIELIGLPGIERADLDHEFLASLPPRPDGSVRIALAHFPDLFEQIAAAPPDIFLAGHTHGGQICLPGGWPPLTHAPGPRRYATGIHRRGNCWYIVNRGLGAGKIPVRIFCPPQVIEIELVPGGE